MLTIGNIYAVAPFKTEIQVEKTEKNLYYQKDDSEKVKTILNLSKWYLSHYTDSKVTARKSLSYAFKALSISENIKYQEGVSESCLQLAVVLQQAKEYLKAKIYAKKAIEGFTKINEQDQLGESWVMYWSASFLSGTPYKERIPLLQNAANAFHKSGNKLREGDCYRQLGDIYQILGNGPDAIYCLKKALSFCPKNDLGRLYELYNLMGSAYLYSGDHKTAITYGLKSARLAEKLKIKSIFLCTVYNRIGLIYFEFQDFKSAQKYFSEALNIAIKENDIYAITKLTHNYSDVLLKQNQPKEAFEFLKDMESKFPGIYNNESVYMESQYMEIYMRFKQYNKAQTFVKPIKDKIKNVADYEEKLTAYLTLLKLSFKQKNYDQASKYCNSYDSTAKNIQNYRFNANVSFWKYAIDSAQGNCLSAMNNYRKYVGYTQNIYDDHKAKEINKMTILYETEKKNKNILQLQNKSILQNNKLHQADILKKLMIFSILLLLIIVGLLFRAYKVKQRNNKILNDQQNEIYQKNKTLQHLVVEKEWLLREIHHRIKNNLHMVVGLLASQTEFLKNEEAVQAINNSQNRIQAMSLIHQKLYQSENLSIIDMPSYIFELTEYLKDSFEIRNTIRFILNIDSFNLPLSHSIPIGLIFNEAVTNAIKYAFPNQENGIIDISLKTDGNSNYTLIIHDNGIGLPPDFDPYNNPSLGVKLMHGLSADIEGKFLITSVNGTKISLEFTFVENNLH